MMRVLKLAGAAIVIAIAAAAAWFAYGIWGD
jgi:hypothetical protein